MKLHAMRGMALLGSLILAAVGCSDDDGETENGMVSYATSVEPLLVAKCTPCHVNTAAPSGGLDLSSGVGYTSLVGMASVLEPNKVRVGATSAESYLIQKLEGTQVTGEPMPKDSPVLPANEIQMIRDWIDGGALQ